VVAVRGSHARIAQIVVYALPLVGGASVFQAVRMVPTSAKTALFGNMGIITCIIPTLIFTRLSKHEAFIPITETELLVHGNGLNEDKLWLIVTIYSIPYFINFQLIKIIQILF